MVSPDPVKQAAVAAAAKQVDFPGRFEARIGQSH
jgi:hypothetical protein